MINSVHHESSGMTWVNSHGERIDSKLLETPINDNIGNDPDTVIDFIDKPSGKRITFSKKEYMGLMNAVHNELYSGTTKEEFVNVIDSVGMLTVGLVHPISKNEMLAFMNENADKQTIKSSNNPFSALAKVGVKLTKEELLALLKKSMQEKKAYLKGLEQTPKIDTQTLLKSQKNIESIQQKPTILEQLLTK